jgi:hypothetical protein
VAEQGLGPTGQDSRRGALEGRNGRAADGVDAAVDAEEAAGSPGIPNRAPPHAERQQLLGRDVSVLPSGDVGDLGPW